MTLARRLRLATVAAGALGMAFAASAAGAQSQNVQNNALQGFAQNRDQPVRIDSASLMVLDKDKIATFSGNVRLVQGDTTLRCKTLAVFYQPDSEKMAPGAMKSAAPLGPGGSQSIRRIEARGDVIVVRNDQKASGDNGVFDMKTNTVTLVGNVVMSRCQDVVMGERVVVNLTTGVSRVGCKKNCQTLINANSCNAGRPDAASDALHGPGGNRL